MDFDRAMVKDTPADKRLYSFEEMVLFLDGLGCLPSEVGESNEDAVRAWVEHMDFGGVETVVGRPMC